VEQIRPIFGLIWSKILCHSQHIYATNSSFLMLSLMKQKVERLSFGGKAVF